MTDWLTNEKTWRHLDMSTLRDYTLPISRAQTEMAPLLWSSELNKGGTC
jgi:hypothetical protein